MDNSIFIFRRDLRLQDNTGLLAALKESDKVIPCFFLDPTQLEENEYRSDNSVQFMLESLQDLEKQLSKKDAKLYVFYGKPTEAIGKLIDETKIKAVYVNRDYTPHSLSRDNKIKEICEKKDVAYKQYGDCMLNEPEAVLKADGRPYTIFSAYLHKAQTLKVRKPKKNNHRNYYTKKLISKESQRIYKKIIAKKNERIKLRGGRAKALARIQDLGRYRNYGKERDFPYLDATTHLSPHLKFGTCSIREVYYAIYEKLGKNHELIRQLYWRDFFTQIGFFSPHIYGTSFHKRYDNLNWSYDKEKFIAWCEGKTGFPIVDAGMRELNETGFINNRVRMITASFLTKDLHIDWRWGEKYFAQKLVDYDPAVNNGNWQWIASTGCDAQPYFRIFNPWLQQKKYDPKCSYIKKWVPELRELSAAQIHSLDKRRPSNLGYPKPIVDHTTEAAKTKSLYEKIRQGNLRVS